MEGNKIKGGLADNTSKEGISKKFNVTIQKLDKEIAMGIKVEMEHVNSKALAKEIAMDHLTEIPDYYTRLKKMEKEASKKWNVKESTKNNIKRLFREQVDISVTDETPDVSTFSIIYNDRPVGSLWVSKPKDIDMAIEIVSVEIKPDHNYKAMEIISEMILAIWDTYPDAHKILVTPEPKSRTFWHKMGANRLNDDYLMIVRGH